MELQTYYSLQDLYDLCEVLQVNAYNRANSKEDK